MEVVAASRPGRGDRQSGFSLVEMLVASMLLLVVILGVVPLFVRSMISNTGGNEYTQLSNFSKSQVEELFQLDFNDARLTIPAGDTEVSVDEYWDETAKKWKSGPVPAGTNPPWTRNTVVRQYNVSAVDQTLENFDVEKAEALDGGVAATAVHLKEIVITVESTRRGPLGPGRELVLRTLKAK
jgi:prepilin-type N-terminal cleavage/methylation domain-containing protein